MKNMLILIALIVTALTASSCVSPSSRPYYVSEVAISELEETTIRLDSSRYAGINLIVRNDSGSDIFMRSTHRGALLSAPANQDERFRFPDEEEQFRAYSGSGIMPLMMRDFFVYIWNRNKGAYHFSNQELEPNSIYYLPVIYYHTEDSRFYTRSVRIIAGREQNVGDNAIYVPGVGR